MRDLYVVVCRNKQEIVSIHRSMATAKEKAKGGVTSCDVFIYQPSIRIT